MYVCMYVRTYVYMSAFMRAGGPVASDASWLAAAGMHVYVHRAATNQKTTWLAVVGVHRKVHDVDVCGYSSVDVCMYATVYWFIDSLDHASPRHQPPPAAARRVYTVVAGVTSGERVTLRGRARVRSASARCNGGGDDREGGGGEREKFRTEGCAGVQHRVVSRWVVRGHLEVSGAPSRLVVSWRAAMRWVGCRRGGRGPHAD